jgi:FlaG/FlaF family flagellin (archaellin)
MYLSKLRRRVRAISPVLAVLMMIVIAVAGSLVTYAWVMGYLSFTTAKAGRAIQIQSIANAENDADLVVYVQNVGEGTVTLDPTGAALVYVNGGLLPCTVNPPADGLLLEGATATILVPGAAGGPGEQVRVKVVSMGGTFTEAAAYPGESTGGGGILPPPDVIQVSSVADTGFSGVQAGDLLVVMPNHRTGTFTTGGETCTAAGYTTVEVASFMTTSGNRRAVALLIRVADGTETGPVTCTWGSGVTTYATLYQVYRGATTWTSGESGVNNGDGTLVPTLAVPSTSLSAGTGGNILTIGAIVTRDDPGTVTMSNLGSIDIASSGGSYPAVTISGFNYGDAVTDTVATLTTARMASGLLAQISCS